MLPFESMRSAVFITYHRALPSHLSRAEANPLVSGQLIQAHRAARAHFVRADADLGAHAEFAAVGKARAGVPINGSAVHFGEESMRGGFVLRDDAIAVGAAITVDMLDGGPNAIHNPNVEDVIVIFSGPVGLGDGLQLA